MGYVDLLINSLSPYPLPPSLPPYLVQDPIFEENHPTQP